MPIIIAVASIVLACRTSAQEPEPPPAEETAPPAGQSDAAGSEATEEPAAQVPVSGDVLILKDGSPMRGVQILRATPHFYEVQVLEGMRPLQIPRRRVKEVIYDDIDPNLEKLKQELFPEEQEVTIASGERVTSALRDKLMAPVVADPISFQNRDFVEILEELNASLQVNLRINQSIRDLQPRQRLWTVEIPLDKTLLAFLREDLVGAFDFVEVLFESDRIIVLTKEAAKNRAANPPPADPATAPPPSTPEG